MFPIVAKQSELFCVIWNSTCLLYLFNRYQTSITRGGIFNGAKSQLYENDLGIRILQ